MIFNHFLLFFTGMLSVAIVMFPFMFFVRTQFSIYKLLFWNYYLVKRKKLTLVISLEESNL